MNNFTENTLKTRIENKTKFLELYLLGFKKHKQKDKLKIKYFDLEQGRLRDEFLTDRIHNSLIKKVTNLVGYSLEVLSDITILDWTFLIMEESVPSTEIPVVNFEEELRSILGMIGVKIDTPFITKSQITKAKEAIYHCIPNREPHPGCGGPKLWQGSDVIPMTNEHVIVIFDQMMHIGKYSNGKFIKFEGGDVYSWNAIYSWISMNSIAWFTKVSEDHLMMQQNLSENLTKILRKLKLPSGRYSLPQVMNIIYDNLKTP